MHVISYRFIISHPFLEYFFIIKWNCKLVCNILQLFLYFFWIRVNVDTHNKFYSFISPPKYRWNSYSVLNLL